MAVHSAKAHKEAMLELVEFMRETGMTSYRGPLMGRGWKVDAIQLELGSAPVRAAPVEPEAKRKKGEHEEPPKRDIDGLTEEEQRVVYMHVRGV